MSDFLGKVVDRHTDKLPRNFKWYVIGIIIILILLSKYRIMGYKPIYNTQTNVGSGGSGNNVSGVVLQ